MRLPTNLDLHLGYCLNVHPGATRDEMERAVFERAPDVYVALSARQAVTGPFGVGAWFSAAVAKELLQPGALADFSARLRDAGLYVFTLNGFPYGPFHGARVKEKVYSPDWSAPERKEHTLRLASILAALLPDGVEGTISTVPVTYRAWGDEARVAAAVQALRETALALHRLKEETGRTIRLALEPEPDCLLDDPYYAAEFFNDQIFAETENEYLLRQYLGVCLDTVHCGVMGMSPEESLQQYIKADIGVFKVQLGAALEVRGATSTEIPALLTPFSDVVYLHQTVVTLGDMVKLYPDLPEALREAPAGGEWRVHFHVPLTWSGEAPLGSTRDEIDAAFFRAAVAAGVRHFESEIYTLGVFPDAKGHETAILANELAWLYEQLQASSL